MQQPEGAPSNAANQVALFKLEEYVLFSQL
jgi:hypothetical protein